MDAFKDESVSGQHEDLLQALWRREDEARTHRDPGTEMAPGSSE